jgi:hypothetical protein
MKLILPAWISLLSYSFCLSQIFPPKNYPKGYFRNPLGVPIRLAANFGELRANHFHMGLDIRTEKKENLPVYAAADGYVVRVKVEPGGFGQAIYINHPNGYTTLYAHLNAFFPALAAFVEEQQYKKETWKITLDIPAGKFPVRKGDFIALSGNTGGSQGPHLHFEIRRTSDDINLNPLLFGLPVTDHTSPVISRLALYDATQSPYEQSPRIFPVKKSPAGFSLAEGTLVSPSPRVSFAIGASDTQSGSRNPNGIYEADISDNGKPVIGFQMDRISYDNTRNVNAHIDYKTKATGGPDLQQLFLLPGYTQSIYKTVSGNGGIDVSDGQPHHIRIEVRDPYGNRSRLEYRVSYGGIPAGTVMPPGKIFYPGILDAIETEDLSFYIGEKCLYDSVHINFSRSAALLPGVVSMLYSVGEPYIPLGDYFLVRIKPSADLAPEKMDRVVMQRITGEKTEVQKVEWQGGWASARFRDFGRFQLILDEDPPVITAEGFSDGANLAKASRIVIQVKDNLDSYRNFRAELDGRWIRFTNDKELAFIYKFDRHCPTGQHVLKISVEDEAGNRATRSFQFTR